jgi:ubiquinone/menaquinone biosynthesis C-methylase UbiE
VQDGEAVLEVAVGTGILFGEILACNRQGRSVGVDLTPAMLRRARRRAERLGRSFLLARCDGQALSFGDGRFDLIFTNNLLGLVPEAAQKRILAELVRVLRPGGRLVVVTMVPPETRAARWLYRLGVMALGGWRDVPVIPLMTEAGLETVPRETVFQLGMPSEIVVARRRPSVG